MMSKYLKYVFVLAGILFTWLFIKSCDGPEEVVSKGPLPQEETLRVSVKDNVVSVETTHGTESVFIPDHGNAVVDVNKNGDVTLNVKNKGFTFVPVLGAFISQTPSVALGAQVGYWNRLELYGGLLGPKIAGFGAVGYRLDQIHLNNTSLFVGYSTKKEIGVGVLVRF